MAGLAFVAAYDADGWDIQTVWRVLDHKVQVDYWR
jgi:hypothetical protein